MRFLRLRGDNDSHSRSREVCWVLAASSELREDVDAHAIELRAHGVPVVLERDGDTWLVLVPLEDRGLAVGLIGAPDDVGDLLAEREAPRRTGWWRTAAVLGAGTLALAAMVAVTPGETDASHWSASGRAYHSDDDGDGTIDRIVICNSERIPTSVWLDRDHDGVLDRMVRFDREHGLLEELYDDDGDGAPDRRILFGEAEETTPYDTHAEYGGEG